MIKTILTAAGVPFRRSRFLQPPAETYAVYMDDISTDGPDGLNRIFNHDITVEVYEPEPDDMTEAAIEAAIDAQGLHWTKQDRYWLQDVQRYQVIYEFNYIVKN